MLIVETWWGHRVLIVIMMRQRVTSVVLMQVISVTAGRTARTQPQLHRLVVRAPPGIRKGVEGEIVLVTSGMVREHARQAAVIQRHDAFMMQTV